MKKPASRYAPKPVKIPTPQSLANIALYYLQRFAASEASLRRVLQNRLRRVAIRRPDFAADNELQQKLHSAIENIIEAHKKSGAINDKAFAEIKVNSLRRQGKSRRGIEQKLAAKGIQKTLVAEALESHAEELPPEEADYCAALALAKKRKLGPFRKKDADDDKKRKEFGVLARAGFSSAIAKRVLKAQIEEEWE